MESIISTHKLVKEFYGDGTLQRVIDKIDLEIYKGDFTIIMGSSGAGKSTLMYSLSGMDRPTSGKVIFNSEDITKMSDDRLAVFRRKNCGFVFQAVYLLEKMSLMDNVLVSGMLTYQNKKELIDNAKKLFKKVNISETIYKKMPNQISGGEASRVGIVRAAINKPSVVFADEPTGALNSENAKAVLDVLTDLNNDGQSIIMVTHDKKSALRGNRIIYLKDGKICGELSLSKYQDDDQKRNDKLDKFLREMGW